MSASRNLSGLVVAIGLLLLAACGGRSLVPGSAAPGQGNNAAAPTGPLLEEFIPGQTGNWLLEGDEASSTAVVSEQLVITVDAPNTMQYATYTDRAFDNFVLEVDAWQRSGAPESSYGVLFRVTEDGQFYRFDITGNGLYMVERRAADGTWARLVREWTPTAAINQGLNVANRLKIIANGPDLSFYVNGILLTQVSDANLTSGAIALDAGSFAGKGLQVAFDNVSVTPGSG